MLERMEVISNQGSLLNLPLEDVVSGYLLEEVQGLDPVKATITSSSFAQLDGGQYQSSRREARNIIVTITLEPEYGVSTVRQLRRDLYNYFMPKTEVGLRFYSSDMNPAWISGRVESLETALFSAEPAVDISILCFNPDFYEPVPIAMTGNTYESTGTDLEIDYTGSVETGLAFTLNVNRTLSTFSVYVVDPAGSTSQLDFSAPLQAGDVVEISTVPGNKYARLTRGGVITSILYGISPQSKWLEIHPGESTLRVQTPGAAIPYSIEYIRKHGGL